MQDLSSEESPDGLIANWLHATFGGLAHFVPGAAAARAISRLVIGAANVPGAGLDWLAHRVQDDDSARSEMKRIIVAAAGKAADADPEFATRALISMAGKIALGQTNREAVARQAIELLQSDPAPAGIVGGPSDDFMNVFCDRAEHASSDELRDLFARVLAGEIRRPGAFSLRTLEFIAIMDAELAEAVRAAKPWIIVGDRILDAVTVFGSPDEGTLRLLADTGLLPTGNSQITAAGTGGALLLEVQGKGIVGYGSRDKFNDTHLPFGQLSPTGHQMMSLLPDILDPRLPYKLAECIGAFYDTVPGHTLIRIDVGDVVRSPAGLTLQNAVAVWTRKA